MSSQSISAGLSLAFSDSIKPETKRQGDEVVLVKLIKAVKEGAAGETASEAPPWSPALRSAPNFLLMNDS